ncbi:MAG TPA: Gfo/Idh/MocA family oxidoreductase [Sphingomicrobium sp.]|nr:Gfo/Idh/MocA family oxidoreductase [Sphingomicrobium sp.]
MVNVGVVGLGKMGLSHFSIINAHQDTNVVGLCDSSGYILDILTKYTGVSTYSNLETMLDGTDIDAVVIATPSKYHAPMVRTCLERGIHVFCEKPFCLDPADSVALAQLASDKRLVTQVGYHNRHIATFREVKRLLEAGALGTVTHVLAEAYGPVVLKPKGGTWRSKKEEGGGALYDYAAHPADVLTWYFGRPESISGTVLGKVFSAETEDEVFTTLNWPGGLSGQLSVSWSDESHRKMTTCISIWGTNGKIVVDRQELRIYLRDAAHAPEGYAKGWTVRYTTELTDEVDFYVRGEEYSAQVDVWLKRIGDSAVRGTADFIDASVTDEVLNTICNNTDGGLRHLGAQAEIVDEQSLSAAAVGFWTRLKNRHRNHRLHSGSRY